MPNIESIRPGEVLESSFAEYALPDLMIGILRGNLNGVLDIALSNVRANYVVFKEGVPIAVTLPDVDVSLSRILIGAGELDPKVGESMERKAKEIGSSESRVMSLERVVAEGALHDGMRVRARAQMARLFDVGNKTFRFIEGAGMPPNAELAILQPLPVIYQGLSTAKNRSLVSSFLARFGNHRFRLSDTYPRGIDPFEWGPDLEKAIAGLEKPLTLDALADTGFPPEALATALAALHLADMIELLEPISRAFPSLPTFAALAHPEPVTSPATPAIRALPDDALIPLDEPDTAATLEPRPSSPPELSGLKPLAAIKMPPSEPITERPVSHSSHPPAPGGGEHELERGAVAKRLDPILGKSYYEILRATAGSSLEQLERAKRWLLRQPGAQDADPAARCWRELVEEAYAAVSSPSEGPRYRELSERSAKKQSALRERMALEAEPKIERAVTAMADGRTGEAAYLLAWAQDLDGFRRDLRLHRAFLAYCRTPPADRPGVAKVLRSMISPEALKAPADLRLQLYMAVVHAELGEEGPAREILARSKDRPHPLRRMAERLLARRAAKA